MIFPSDLAQNAPARQGMLRTYYAPEHEIVPSLLTRIQLSPLQIVSSEERARRLIEGIRSRGGSPIDQLTQLYSLSHKQGRQLMALVESLLRVPDALTREKLLQDKLSGIQWAQHEQPGWMRDLMGRLLNWAGHLSELSDSATTGPFSWVKQFVGRTAAPLLQQSALYAMRHFGHTFILGNTLQEALKQATKSQYLYSFDMLGEAAYTEADATRYFEAYLTAIQTLGTLDTKDDILLHRPSVSVKLSALHPRYEYTQYDSVVSHLTYRLLTLAKAARAANIALTVDAEEAHRLDLSLDVFEAVLKNPSLQDWDGLGLAVQAYQKRLLPLIDWLKTLAEQTEKRIPVRLVKGAYWDSEIKAAQEQGLPGYPVFTRKIITDISYLAGAEALLAHPTCFYPQFATHNAQTAATLLEMVGPRRDFEFQRLHGMGAGLYEMLLKEDPTLQCRIYAPVGDYRELLPYLVRRLLENGANSSFVHHMMDPEIDPYTLSQNPLQALPKDPKQWMHRNIPLPRDLFIPARRNSKGLDFSNQNTLLELDEDMKTAAEEWRALDDINVTSDAALDTTHRAFRKWSETPVLARAEILDRVGDLLEARRSAFMTYLVQEGRKTLRDAGGEVREAVDFARYYAAEARKELAMPRILPGPTGEINELSRHPRGVFLAISPWNFPLSIFIGQILAALVTGNTVIAKPASPTRRIAQAAVDLLYEAGVPQEALQLVLASGTNVSAHLLPDPRIAGVVFTGGTQTAREISQHLAARTGPLIPMIAETGGMNAMIVDTSALAEQVVRDAVLSAFGSAGQRCSALRLLFLPHETAPQILDMLIGATETLVLGDPVLLNTDIGPLIHASALKELKHHVTEMSKKGKLLYAAPLRKELEKMGPFMPPHIFELHHPQDMVREAFGPILHVVRYHPQDLNDVIDAINHLGYGLTLGLQSRLDTTIAQVRARAHVGNFYVNRAMVGAVPGVHPFGGEGLSGTGPKAGGPHYLAAFTVERTFTNNITASGGNPGLVSLEEW